LIFPSIKDFREFLSKDVGGTLPKEIPPTIEKGGSFK